MNQNFEHCMEMLLEHEGGFVDVNQIGDPGGLTNLGVTKRTYDEFHGCDIDEEGMRNLTVDDVTPIYRRNYWERCRCRICRPESTGPSMTLVWNHGTGRAAKFLQKAVMVNQDGSIGPQTLMAVSEIDPAEIINRMAVYRDAFYRSLSTFKTFGRGWIARNDTTRDTALAMVTGPK